MNLPPEEQGIYESYIEDLYLKASLYHTQKFKLEQAEKEGVMKVAKNLKKMGINTDKIIEATGLTKKEIEEL